MTDTIISEFRHAAASSNAVSFSDGDLEQQIFVLRCLITYFEARGNCGILLPVFRQDLLSFERMKEERNRKW